MSKKLVLTVFGTIVLFFGLLVWSVVKLNGPKTDQEIPASNQLAAIPAANEPEPVIENSEDALAEEPQTTTEIDTSDWLTYRNEEYGYIIRYPKQWGITALPFEIGNPLKVEGLSTDQKGNCYVLIWALPSRVGYGYDKIPIAQMEIELNGLKGEKIVLEDSRKQFRETMIYFNANETFYTISFPLNETFNCTSDVEEILQSFDII